MPINPDAYMAGAIPTLSRGGSWMPGDNIGSGAGVGPGAAGMNSNPTGYANTAGPRTSTAVTFGQARQYACPVTDAAGSSMSPAPIDVKSDPYGAVNPGASQMRYNAPNPGLRAGYTPGPGMIYGPASRVSFDPGSAAPPLPVDAKSDPDLYLNQGASIFGRRNPMYLPGAQMSVPNRGGFGGFPGNLGGPMMYGGWARDVESVVRANGSVVGGGYRQMANPIVPVSRFGSAVGHGVSGVPVVSEGRTWEEQAGAPKPLAAEPDYGRHAEVVHGPGPSVVAARQGGATVRGGSGRTTGTRSDVVGLKSVTGRKVFRQKAETLQAPPSESVMTKKERKGKHRKKGDSNHSTHGTSEAQSSRHVVEEHDFAIEQASNRDTQPKSAKTSAKSASRSAETSRVTTPESLKTGDVPPPPPRPKARTPDPIPLQPRTRVRKTSLPDRTNLAMTPTTRMSTRAPPTTPSTSTRSSPTSLRTTAASGSTKDFTTTPTKTSSGSTDSSGTFNLFHIGPTLPVLPIPPSSTTTRARGYQVSSQAPGLHRTKYDAPSGYIPPMSEEGYDRYLPHPAAPVPDRIDQYLHLQAPFHHQSTTQTEAIAKNTSDSESSSETKPTTPSYHPSLTKSPNPSQNGNQNVKMSSDRTYRPLGYAPETRKMAEINRSGPAMARHGIAWERKEEASGLVLGDRPEGPRWVVARPPREGEVKGGAWWESGGEER